MVICGSVRFLRINMVNLSFLTNMTVQEISVFLLSIELILACLAAITVSIVCIGIFKVKKQPPCLGYWQPWIGCAVQFGKEPLCFIERARRKLGPLFTLKVMGQRLTFVTDASDISMYFNSSFLDFQQAVQKPVSKTASVSRTSFTAYHTKIHDMLKHRLASSKLETLFADLNMKFSKHIVKIWSETGQGSLFALVRKSMYAAVLENLMGEDILPLTSKADYEMLEEHFVTYDDQFEYGSQLPALLLRDWNRSKMWLLNMFRDVVTKLSLASPDMQHQTVLQTLIATVDQDSAANYSLLLMWASLANAIPITFWALAYILSSESILQLVKMEADDVVGGDGEKMVLTDMQRAPLVKQCVLEAIRLHSPGTIARYVTKAFTLHGYTIPAGDQLMLSPYWCHRNPTLFPEPDLFQPQRWEKADLEKNLFLDGFVAFGGGRYQCPGRWFALMEIQLFIIRLLSAYNITTDGPAVVPKPSPLHLVGTQLPLTAMPVSYRRRYS